MALNRHIYLRNNKGTNDGFKKSRFVKVEANDEPEIEASKFPNPTQQDRLRRANAIFYSERKQRVEKRTIEVPAVIEIVIIRFFKVFNSSLKKEFYSNYGMLVSAYEDFNKTVYFEILDQTHFKTFIKHLELFYESSPSETYQGKEYNLIALINDFRFLSSKRRIKSYSAEISCISLISPQNKQAANIYDSLISHLQTKQKPFYQTELSFDIIEVSNLSKEDVEEIVDNFDIVKTVTSSRVERRRPGAFGEERRDYGFEVNVGENLPTVGVIDTGFFRIEPLRPCLASISFDLTNTSAFIDDSGHGTAVGCLVALGEEFINEIKTSYQAKAKIAVIKAIQSDNDALNILRLADTIKEAYTSHGIQIFNLSLNDPLPKSYNKHISDYAYILDKLAFENDLLIFISVGNIPEQRLKELIIDEPHASHEYPDIFYSLDNRSEIHSCETTNISEPSESMNNVSVGAIAGNLEGNLSSDITPAEEYPAYYTRKFHYDYEQLVNGSEFMRSQKNKHLNKPDLVFEGGDLFKYESGLEILRSPIEPAGDRYFSRGAGTSYSTPLIASYAATIKKRYPSLNLQTIKALLINSSESPCGDNPPLFRGYSINLLKKLTGFGRPKNDLLTGTDNNSVTFIIEGEIELEELQTILISIPTFINKSGNKLNFKTTLSYSFLPVKDNHLCYLPFQITFGIFKPIEANAMGKMKTEDYRIKQGMSWSDDFFGIENRLFSNVQQRDDNVSGEQIALMGNKVSLAIKCTGKSDIPDSDRKHLEATKHKFSLVLTITELPTSRANNKLYQEIIAINTIEAIASIEGEATIEAEI
ncbi:MAG: S8 family peptidase [Bacteroidetes bacterium]|nr:S8 family peptidase [Bacteroidota bacterium]